jgi:NAD-dependent SIR2 family protein deacetylase
MGDVIDFNGSGETYVFDRSCGECGNSTFFWQTSETDTERQFLVCTDCNEVYGILGEDC